MRLGNLFRTVAFAAVFVGASSAASAQGKVVVAHDEWFTGACCFGSNEQRFMANVTGWFGMSSGSSLLVYTNNGFLTDGAFIGWANSKGISVTVNAGATNFGAYDAVITSGNGNLFSTGGLLAGYVFGGGNVIDIGGTGNGGAGTEAAYNNVFLNAFGLGFAGSYNGLGTTNTAGFASQGPYGAALFTNVSSVYANNGNDVLMAAAVSGVDNQIFYDQSGNGVFAAAQVTGVTATPEPATIALMSTGLMGLAPFVKRRRRA